MVSKFSQPFTDSPLRDGRSVDGTGRLLAAKTRKVGCGDLRAAVPHHSASQHRWSSRERVPLAALRMARARCEERAQRESASRQLRREHMTEGASHNSALKRKRGRDRTRLAAPARGSRRTRRHSPSASFMSAVAKLSSVCEPLVALFISSTRQYRKERRRPSDNGC